MRTSKQIKKEIEKLRIALEKAEARELKTIQKSCNHDNLEYYEVSGHIESYPRIDCLDCQKEFDLSTLSREVISKLQLNRLRKK